MTVEEFKIEVLPLKNKLFRFALRLLANVQDAEDMVQDVFLKLWNLREKLRKYKSIEAFAMVVLKNMCLDKLKSKGYRNDVLTEKTGVPVHSGVDIVLTDVADKIKIIMEGLPQQQKMIVHLRDVEGYEYEEIAGLLHMSVNNVRVSLSRARKKIREVLIKTYDYEFTGN